ncbi:hypothetical protein JL720_4672 [Aureococcus anophagefferens]|nr:hypothetical protein JL720_4672 [Aureococcus anophagefferens]
MAILPAYERGCRHGAPSRARCRERRDTARRVEAVEKLGEALDGVLATGDAVDAASLEVLLRRFEPAAHPEALLVAQAMTIDALAAGRPEAGRHFAVARDKARAGAAAAATSAAPAVAAALDAEGNGAAYAPLLLAACPGDARGAVAYADARAAEANRAAAPSRRRGVEAVVAARRDGALVRADAVAGLLAVAAEQPHGDAREVSLRLLRNLTAAWASAFAEDRARTYDFLEPGPRGDGPQGGADGHGGARAARRPLQRAPRAAPHDPRPKTLAKWRWGLARVVAAASGTRPKALAKLAAFGFAAAATLVEGPEAGDAGLLALFADLGVLLGHVARYRPRGFLANLRDNDECIADFLDDCKRRRALLPAALTALAAWGRDRGLSRDD